MQAIRSTTRIQVAIGTVMVALSLTAPNAVGQSRSDGSVYAKFGLGERRSFFSSQAHGMGVLGTALAGPNYLNPSNPAALADQVFTRFAGGVDFVGVRSKDADDRTSTSSGGTLGAVSFGFPLITRRLGVAAAINPYTVTGYLAQNTGTLPADGDEPETAYQVNFEGDGGLHEATLGLGYQVSNNLSLGAAANAVWGIVEFGQRTEYESTSNYLLTTEQLVSTRMSGFSGTLGITFRTSKLVGKSDGFSVGAAFTFPVAIRATRTNIVSQGVVLVDTVGVPVEGDITLPARVQAGIAYAPSAKWLVLADGIYEPWGDFKSDYVHYGYEPGQQDAFNSRYRIGAGFQYIPAGSDPFASRLKRTALRAGIFVEQAYPQPEPDFKLRTYGVAGGLSFPTLLPGTYLDLSAQIGRRGKATTNLVQDLLYKFSITLNFGERWFLQRRLR